MRDAQLITEWVIKHPHLSCHIAAAHLMLTLSTRKVQFPGGKSIYGEQFYSTQMCCGTVMPSASPEVKPCDFLSCAQCHYPTSVPVGTGQPGFIGFSCAGLSCSSIWPKNSAISLLPEVNDRLAVWPHTFRSEILSTF